MITHSNKKCWGGERFLKSNNKQREDRSYGKENNPRRSIHHWKRAYVFDGVKITRMSKNPDGSFGFEKSDVFPLSSSVTVSTELMEERYWEKFYPREMSTDSMIGLIYGFGEEAL